MIFTKSRTEPADLGVDVQYASFAMLPHIFYSLYARSVEVLAEFSMFNKRVLRINTWSGQLASALSSQG